MGQRSLLICGILSSVLYILMNIFVPMGFEGYSISSQTVSELSAIDAPTRTLWVSLAVVYILLFAAFGWGVRKATLGNRSLRIVAGFILVYVIINVYWPPMHLRGNAPTLTDALHIVWAMITLLLMMLIMAFGAAALGRSFRIYTIATFVVFITFGILIGKEAPNIPKNLPTPHIGIWERINIGAYMLWVIVFAIALMRRQKFLFSNGSNAYRADKLSHSEITR